MIRRWFIVAILLLAGGATAMAQGDISVDKSELNFDTNGGKAVVTITEGSDYELFSRCDWMTCTAQNDGTLLIEVEPYVKFYPRRACVVLTSLKTNYSKVIEVQQTGENGRPAYLAAPAGEGIVLLSDMDLTLAKPYFIKEVHKNRSADGNPITLKTTRYDTGIGTHAPTVLAFKVNGATAFAADIAIDDEVLLSGNVDYGQVGYRVLIDGQEKESGKLLMFDNDVVSLNLDLTGAETMRIELTDLGSANGDHVSLGNAYFVVDGEQPVCIPKD